MIEIEIKKTEEIKKAKEIKMLIIWSVVTTILSSVIFYWFLENKIRNFCSWDEALMLAILYTSLSLLVLALIVFKYLSHRASVTSKISSEVAIIAISVAAIPATICNINNRTLMILVIEIFLAVFCSVVIYVVTSEYIINSKRKILKIVAIHGLVVFASISAIIKFCFS